MRRPHFDDMEALEISNADSPQGRVAETSGVPREEGAGGAEVWIGITQGGLRQWTPWAGSDAKTHSVLVVVGRPWGGGQLRGWKFRLG